MKDNDFDELPEYSPANAAGRAINTFRTASIVEPGIINSNVPIAGEKPFLDQAEEYFKSDFKLGSLPEYYTLASRQYKNLDPHDLARIRLEATGRLPSKTKSEYEDCRHMLNMSMKIYKILSYLHTYLHHLEYIEQPLQGQT